MIPVGSPTLLPPPVTAPVDVPPELLKYVVHAAAGVGTRSSSLAKTVSTPVAKLTQEVIRAMDHIDRVVYMLKDGGPVKLGNFVR